jgi:hypothetical protein
MGTPHQGGNGVQLGKLLVNVASIFVAADDGILKHLERDSEWLQHQLGQFGPISGDFVTKFAYEMYETPTALGYRIMVRSRAFQHSYCLRRVGSAPIISRSAGSSECRAVCHPRGPSQYGQVRVEERRRIHSGDGISSAFGASGA